MSASPSPSDDDFLSSDQSLLETLAEVELFVKDLEPKVREINRVLVPLLGKCAASTDGSWAYIVKEDDDTYKVALESIPVESVLGIVARVSEVLSIVADADGVAVSRPSYQPDLGPAIVGDAARLTHIPSTHVRVVRK
jgi:uncharacterized FlaG/YvyC family protein